MRPHKLGRQWIDLDHVLAMTELAVSGGGFYGFNVTLSFQPKDQWLCVGRDKDTPDGHWFDCPVVTKAEAYGSWSEFFHRWTRTQPKEQT
jgi:hypothetical protein